MTPDVGELCSLGERAFNNDEFEEAEAWYELACASGRSVQYVRGDTREPTPHPHAALIANRFARWEQLRAMVRERSVRRIVKPDPGHVLAVMTVKGRNVPSATRSIMSALATWDAWGGRHRLLTDGELGALEGQAQTFFRALRWATKISNLTALTLLEDDVVLSRNALDYIATTRIDPDLAFISWFSIYDYAGSRIPPLLHCIPASKYEYNQAITFPARTVHELLASDALKTWSEPHGADRLYAKVFPDKLVGVHFPNLVQHVGGAESLVGNNAHGLRTSPTFIGEDADALTLIR